jgi:DNA-directed RNA polymerase beta' subunit
MSHSTTKFPFLTPEQIEEIVNIVPLNLSIPRKTAQSYRRLTQKHLRCELSKVHLNPKFWTEFKNEVKKRYVKSLIQPGESVGILCAQSIGEMNTQMTLNSFHHAGISEAAMTSGIAKFQELLSATRNPKIVNNTIYFIRRPQSLEALLECMNGTAIKAFTLKDLCEDIEIYDLGLKGQNAPRLQMLLNWRKLYENQIYPRDIISKIKRDIPDIVVDITRGMHLYVEYGGEIELPVCEEGVDSYILEENKNRIFLTDILIPALFNTQIVGVPNIKEVFMEKNNGEWFIRTVGSNYQKVLSLGGVDATRTVSNNIWDIYEILGIEAARQSLIEEFSSIMGKINSAHTQILVDRMTYAGHVCSISRYTLKNEKSSVIGKASFEESLENFLQASIAGTKENGRGNSASIVCGKKARAGTGFMSLKVNLSLLKQQ